MTSATPTTIFKGDITPAIRAHAASAYGHTVTPPGAFAFDIAERLAMTEVEVCRRTADAKVQVKVTYEVVVAPDMLNVGGTLHGGCSVFLIDTCSSVALDYLGTVLERRTHLVSQALNTTFHGPALPGSKLAIVSTTVAYGARVKSVSSEPIWDVTHGRLCVSATHSKMVPSEAATRRRTAKL
ncbi:hypothetical protein C8T65DRAFT_587539 [Cerioporus squamosus]|nr:hypothetical protein C8T65DRAFT_587539 [Cerioporus squamosus]